jgi:hypothetical protein
MYGIGIPEVAGETTRNSFTDLRDAVTGAAEATRRAAMAVQVAADAQRRLTEATIALRDTCRRVAAELRRPVRVILAEAEEAVRRANWHITRVMPQSIRRPYCRKKGRLLRSLDQARAANGRLRELLTEIVERFPEQEAAAAGIREYLERTDRNLDEIRAHMPRLPFIRTAADGPEGT